MVPAFVRRLPRRALPWIVYAAAALAFAAHLNTQAGLVPKRGEWYSPHGFFVTMQVRSFLSGRLALVAHPAGAGHDWDWGRGGMHQAWGLGVPILAIPFHVVARWYGAPGFPDHLRFLILYGLTAMVLARALHRTAGGELGALVSSTLAAGFVMMFPTFTGMITSRFLIYEQTIATGALWSVGLLAGLLFVFDRCTPGRLAALSAAAGFSLLIRPPLAIYGATTVFLGMLLAHRKGMRPRAMLWGVLAYVCVSSLYFAGNSLRFGSPFNAGYENCISGPFVNRLARWGLSFAAVPFVTAAKEMFATLFLLDPVPAQIMMGTPPAAVAPYAVGERWREYYSPTFDLTIFCVWLASVAVVGVRSIQGRLWRADRDLAGELPALVGAWGVVPALVLFVFYARLGNMVTRYATDMFPAFAAAGLGVGMAIVEATRRRAPSLVASVQMAMTGASALYMASWHGWVTNLSRPTDRSAFAARIADLDAPSAPMSGVPSHFKCGESHGPSPVAGHLEDWHADCSFASGMVFAMPRSRCVSFALLPSGAAWTSSDDESLKAFLATADSDHLARCGEPTRDGETRTLTMCETHPPPYLLDGLRLYSIATLDGRLLPIDRLKLLRIDAASSCGAGGGR